jgi:hypothetical protein
MAKSTKSDAELVLASDDTSLLDLVDNVLNNGVVLSGDLTISLAHVDLVYARLSLLLCAADRVLPDEDEDPMVRHHVRLQKKRRRRALAAGKARQGTAQSRSGRPG